MTFNNSVLLILKQNQGIEFTELYLRIAPRYKNSLSAKAALLRSLKNLESEGLIKRKESSVFITDKGLVSIQIDMKEKLIIKLNEAFKRPTYNIEEIVQLLIVLSERASESSDLLISAKENAEFTIRDISNLQDDITRYQEKLEKMRALLGVQEERFRELNFIDSKSFVFDEEFLKKCKKALVGEKLIVETIDSDFKQKIPEIFLKENKIIVEKEFESTFFKLVLENPLIKMTFYLPKIKCIISKGSAFCFADYNTLKEF